MTQQYTPVAWQDETTSQQGTLINAERLNQMQTAHHYADGFEEVDAVPTADPSVAYHKIVYCTADNTFYRWDGTEWTKDIDDETKALLQQEIARATAAEGVLYQQLEDEHDARVDAEAAINDRITDEATELAQRIATETSTRYTADTALGTRITNETSARETADTNLGNRITAEATARTEADTLLGNRITDETTAREGADTALGNRITAEETRATQAEQANAQAIANRYTKSETDTLLASKADVATTLAGYGITDAYTKAETDTLLTNGSVTKIGTANVGTDTKPIKLVGGVPTAVADTLATQTYVSNTLDGYLPMVRTTGNQTIGGVKTFTDVIVGRFVYNRYIASGAGSGKWVKIATFPSTMLHFTLTMDSRYDYTIVTGSYTDMLTKTHSSNMGVQNVFKMIVETDGTYTLWYQLRLNYNTYYFRNICAERYANEIAVTISTDDSWYDTPTAGQSYYDSQEMAQ